MKRVILLTIFVVMSVLGYSQTVIYVKAGGSGDGSSWLNACGLQTASTTGSVAGTQIWVAAGTYYLTAPLLIQDGVAVYGGFEGIETALSQRNYALNPTIIDAQKSFGAIELGVLSVLNGLTIQNGSASVGSRLSGGGVLMHENARVENCYILNNQALDNGGGIYALSDGLVINTVIAKNKSGKDGAAIYGASLTVRNSTVTENELMTCVSITDISRPTKICSGETATLSVLDAGTYVWNTGETTASITTPALTADATYTVTVTNVDGSCVFVLAFKVEVLPMPTLSIITNKTSANAGELCRFTAVAQPSGGLYHWDDITSSTDTFLVQQMEVTGDLQYSCTYDLNGCVATATGTIVNTNCTPPTAPTTLSIDHPTLCMGDSTVLRLSGGVRNSGKWFLYTGSCVGSLIDSSNMSSNITFKVKPTVATTYYVRGEGCGTQTACVQVSVSMAALPSVITGDTNVCKGSTTQLQNLSSGGTWSVGTSGNISVDASGLVSGLNGGTGTVFYTSLAGCKRSRTVLVKAVPSAIAGDPKLCQGSSRTYTSTPVGGTWSSQSPSIASVNATTGVVTASTINVGSSTLRYTHPTTGCVVSQDISVHQQPSRSSGSRSVCENESTQFTNATVPAGVWSVLPITVASVGTTGLLTGLSAGRAVLSYTLGFCTDTFAVTVNAKLMPIAVADAICVGEKNVATSPNAGGSWMTNPTTVATVNATTGEITGVSAGTFSLVYTLPNGCSRTVARPLTVNPLPAPITGDRSLGVGLTTPLATMSTGGTWSSNSPSIATVNPSTGVVTGIAPGQVILRYAFPTACADTHRMTVGACASIALASGAGSDHQKVCHSATIATVRYTLTNATTSSISWEKEGSVVAQPLGLTYNGVTHTLSGTPSSSGVFTYTISTTDHYSACNAATIVGTLTVYEPVVGGTIAQNQVLCSGSSPEEFISVVSGGGGDPAVSAYKWEVSTDNLVFVTIPGATASTYNDNSFITVSEYYRRQFVDTVCGSAYSNVLTVTVNPLPSMPVVSVVDNTSCSGSNGSITVTSPSSGVTYSLDGTTFGANPLFTGLSQGTYTVYVKNADGCVSSVQTTVGSSSGSPTITAIAVTPNDSVCSNAGGTVTLTPTFTNGGTNPSFSWSPGGANTQNLTIASPTSSTTYTLTITNTQTHCTGLASQAVTVMPAVNITEQPVGDTICVNTTSPTLSVNTAISGRHYRWQSSSDNISFSDIIGATYSTYNVDNTTASALYYRCVISTVAGICPSVVSDVVRVKVLTIPEVTSSTSASICGMGTVALSAVSSVGSSLEWYDAASGGSLLGTGSSFTTPSISATTTYYAQATNGTCVSTPRTAVVATYNPLHTLTTSGTLNQTVCAGTAITPITFIKGGGATNGDLTWSGSSTTTPAGLTATSTSITGTPTVAGTYTWLMTTTGNACTPQTNTGTIIVNALPTLTRVSGSDNQTVCYSSAISTVVYALTGATSSSISWQSGGSSVSQPLGLTYNTSTHTLSGTPTTSGTFVYTITSVGHSASCAAATLSGQLRVYTPVVAGVIAANQTLCSGSSPDEFTSASAGGGGDPLSAAYQWEISTDNSNFSSISGAIAETYNDINNLTATRYYRRKFIDATCGSVLSNVLTVTVNPLPSVPTYTTTDNTSCSGTANGSITVTSSSSGVTYSIDGTTFGANPVFTGLSQGTYTVYVKNTDGCVNTASVSVGNSSGAPNITGFTLSPNDSICNTAGGNITLTPTFTNGGASPTYLWNTGVTTQTLTIPAPTSTTTYTLTITNATTSCTGNASQTVTVMPAIVISAQPTGGDICLGQTSPSLSVTLSTTGSGRTYQWQSSSDNSSFSAISGATNSSYTVPNGASSNLYYRCVISTVAKICPAINSSSVQVKVLPTPSILSTTPGSRCGDGTVDLVAVATNANSIRWFSASTGGSQLEGSPTTSGVTWITPSLTAPIIQKYYAEAYNGVCSSAARTEVTATVSSQHTITPSGTLSQTVCAGTAITGITHAFGGGATGGTLTWTGTAHSTTPPAGIIASATSITGTPTVSGTYTWLITTTGNSCTAKTSTGTITVNVVPDAVTLSGTTPACTSTVLTASGGTNGLIYYQGTTSGGTNTGTQSATATVSATGTYYFRARSAAGCWGAEGSRTVTILPVPTVASSTPAARCGTGTVTLAATSTSNLSWYDVATNGTSLGTGSSFTTPSLSASKTYYVQASNAACSSARTPVTATINPLPTTPTATVVDNTACSPTPANGSITIATQSGVSYSIDGTNYQVSNVFSGLGAGNYTIYVRNATNCEASATVTVSVASGAPAVSVIVVSPNDSVCNTAGGNITLTPTFSNGGASPSFLWAPGGATTQNLTLASPTATTTYTLTVTNATTGCNVSASKRVDVLPAITIATQPVGNTLCVGQASANLSVVVGTTGSGRTYQWQSSSDNSSFSNIASATNSSYSVPNGASLDLHYRCVISTVAKICPAINSSSVQVKVLAVPTITATTPASRCGTGTVVLSATSQAGNTIRWFSVSNGGSQLAGSPSTSGASWTTPSISDSTTYFAEAFNGTCASASRTSVVATVLPEHSLSLTSAAGTTTQTVCAGSAIMGITHTFGGGASGATLTWAGTANASTPPAGITASASSITGSPTTAGTYTWLITTTGNTCTAKTSTGTITVNALPAAVTVSGTTPACGSTTLTASGGSPGTIYFQGTVSGGTAITTASSSESVNTVGTNTYYFRAQSAAGCWGTQGSLAVTINAPIAITTQPATTSLSKEQNSAGAFPTLSVVVTGTSPSYQWYSNATNSNSGGTAISGATFNTYVPKHATVGTLYYYCVVSGASPCPSVTSAVSGAHTVTSPCPTWDDKPATMAVNSEETVNGTLFVSDHEGNIYATVTIGSQQWLAENMRCTSSPTAKTWTHKTGTAASTYAAYYATPVQTCYGILYNWAAANEVVSNESPTTVTLPAKNRGICPSGWHIPTDDEWCTMETAVESGMSSQCVNTGYRGNLASRLAAKSSLWSANGSANTPGNYAGNANQNSSGFSAVPSGYYTGGFGGAGTYAYFWSATQNNINFAWRRYLDNSNAGVHRYYNGKGAGYSVRCVRD